MDVSGRIDRLRAGFDHRGIEALVVSDLTNVRYLTGFTGSAAIVVVTLDGVLFVTDGRYATQSVEQLDAAGVVADIEITSDGHADLFGAATSHLGVVGLEADHVTWAQQQKWSSEWFTSSEVVPTEGLVATLRIVKDQGEIERIAAAAAIADQAFAAVRPLLEDHPSERDFALALDGEMRARGAEGVSFESIVAAGPNGARPHARPSNRAISEGDLLLCDFGALVEGYHSDMSRTMAIGAISPTHERMLQVVTEAQAAGRAVVRAGVPAAEVDRACREVISDAGWGEAFLHSTGHGVGLDIHELPRVSATSDATLEAGYVVTVEPGVYLPEHGGVRIEDLLVVQSDGARILTTTPRDLS